ncbi:MAG: hypothetical protein OXB92_08660 [Acidimicrobiaceae bacterium]|nr:hypothetical protein [Acidimicrobiia bacterium]MCY4493910.1 hypothetical protein [Acidimicrobiaceae bacterium]
MPEVLEQVKSAAYASVGVNLLVTDAIAGREVPTPDFIEAHATLARKHATKALKEFRAFTEPRAAKLGEQLPSRVAEMISNSSNKAWNFIGIETPEAAATATTTTKQPTAKATKPASAKTTANTSTPADTETAAEATKPADTETAESVKTDDGATDA